MEKFSVVDALDRGIKKRALRLRKEHIPKKGHSISDHGRIIDGEYDGSCLRKQAYDWYEQEPTDLDPKRLYAAFFGDKHHEGFVELLLEDDWEIMPEVQLKPFKHPDLKHNIRGRLDAWMKKGTVAVLAEFKTMQGKAIRGYHSRSGGGFDGIKDTGAKPQHKAQLSWYRHLHEQTADHYNILYFARDDYYRLEYEGGFDFDFVDLAVPYWVMLEEYLEKGELPPRDIRVNANQGVEKFPCSYCWYRSLCWGLHQNI